MLTYLSPPSIIFDASQENCATLEESIRSQCATLIEAIQRRRDELISVARLERDNRLAKICDKVTQCSRGLQGTTSLLQLCIEALKEPEPTVFLQVNSLALVFAMPRWVKSWGSQCLLQQFYMFFGNEYIMFRALIYIYNSKSLLGSGFSRLQSVENIS